MPKVYHMQIGKGSMFQLKIFISSFFQLVKYYGKISGKNET
jgi:hypothetical protein